MSGTNVGNIFSIWFESPDGDLKDDYLPKTRFRAGFWFYGPLKLGDTLLLFTMASDCEL